MNRVSAVQGYKQNTVQGFIAKNSLLIILFTCIFYSAFSWSVEHGKDPDKADTSNVSEPEKALLQKTLEQLGSFEAHYEQSVENSSGRIIEQSKGYFASAENKKFRNDVTHPYQLQTISDGHKLWIIDQDLEQVTVGFLSDYLKDSPLALLLTSADKNNKNQINPINQINNMLEAFSVSYVKNDERQQELFKLRSLDKQTLFSEIRLALKQKNITYIEMDERSGNRVRLNFTRVKKLTTINENLFKAKFPDSFELIDDTLQNGLPLNQERSLPKSNPAEAVQP